MQKAWEAKFSHWRFFEDRGVVGFELALAYVVQPTLVALRSLLQLPIVYAPTLVATSFVVPHVVDTYKNKQTSELRNKHTYTTILNNTTSAPNSAAPKRTSIVAAGDLAPLLFMVLGHHRLSDNQVPNTARLSRNSCFIVRLFLCWPPTDGQQRNIIILARLFIFRTGTISRAVPAYSFYYPFNKNIKQIQS